MDLWRRFLRDLEHQWRDLPEAERSELRAEVIAHFREAMNAAAGDEHDRLAAAITAFGPPSPAPPRWLKGAALLSHYIALPVIGCGALIVVLLAALGLSDLIPPHGAGLYVWPDGDFALSFERQDGARDVAGPAFAPLLISVATMLGFGLRKLWAFAIAPDGRAAQLSRR